MIWKLLLLGGLIGFVLVMTIFFLLTVWEAIDQGLIQ